MGVGNSREKAQRTQEEEKTSPQSRRRQGYVCLCLCGEKRLPFLRFLRLFAAISLLLFRGAKHDLPPLQANSCLAFLVPPRISIGSSSGQRHC
jgi:hypothetical protein